MECLLCVAFRLWAKDIMVNRAGSALPGNESTDKTYYGLHESRGRGRDPETLLRKEVQRRRLLPKPEGLKRPIWMNKKIVMETCFTKPCTQYL